MTNHEIYIHIENIINKYIEKSLEAGNNGWEKDQATAKRLMQLSTKYYKLWREE